MSEAILILNRKLYRGETTIGELILPDGRKFFTLEDTVRGWGIKDPGNTAVPFGKYSLTVSLSSRFKREMVMVYSEANKYELKAGGISFKGIRMHGGNTNKDTWGCIIVAKNNPTPTTVQGSAEKEITEYVKSLIAQGRKPMIEIKNLSQKE